jgi:hypothetical protein
VHRPYILLPFIQATPENLRAPLPIPVCTPGPEPSFTHCYVGQNLPTSLRLTTTVKLKTMQQSKRRRSPYLVRCLPLLKTYPARLMAIGIHQFAADSSGLLSLLSEFCSLTLIQMTVVMTAMTAMVKKPCSRSRIRRSPSVTRAKHCLLQMMAIVTKSLRTSLARILVKMKKLMLRRTVAPIPALAL